MNRHCALGEAPLGGVPVRLLAGAASTIRRSLLVLSATCGIAATASGQVRDTLNTVTVQVTPARFVGYCPANLTLTMTVTTQPGVFGNLRYRILGNNPLPQAINNWGSVPAGATFQIGFPFTIAGDFTGTAIVQTFSPSNLQATQPVYQSPQANFSVLCLKRILPTGPQIPPRVP